MSNKMWTKSCSLDIKLKHRLFPHQTCPLSMSTMVSFTFATSSATSPLFILYYLMMLLNGKLWFVTRTPKNREWKQVLYQKIKSEMSIAQCDNLIDDSFNICTHLSLHFYVKVSTSRCWPWRRLVTQVLLLTAAAVIYVVNLRLDHTQLCTISLHEQKHRTPY